MQSCKAAILDEMKSTSFSLQQKDAILLHVSLRMNNWIRFSVGFFFF